MTVSKAQQKAVNKYVREKYDRINVNMPKGKKELIQEHASRQGMSVNAFINLAIDEKMGIVKDVPPDGSIPDEE